MVLIPIYCAECPGWYELPPQGRPDAFYIWGGDEPPKDLRTPGRVEMHVGHDIRLEKSRFRYQYSGGAGCWILLRYGEPAQVTCSKCSGTLLDSSNFCPHCGSPFCKNP